MVKIRQASRKQVHKVNIQNELRLFDDSFGKTWHWKLDVASLRARMEWVLSLFMDFSSSVNVRFCDAEEMQSYNQNYRNKSKPTDVLSFPCVPGFSDCYWKGNPLYSVGDLLICVPVCFAQSKKHRVTLSAEIEKMWIHGLAHLKGFDHERGEEAFKVMQNLEKSILKVLKDVHGEPLYSDVREAFPSPQKTKLNVNRKKVSP
jgi:probable rRNA maturation factor